MASLYSSYKAIGYVTDGNPFSVNRLGDDNFLTTSIGTSFQVYRTDRLAVCLVSQPCSGVIRSILAIGHETFCVVERDIVVYNRTKVVRVYSEHGFPVLGLIHIGKILISFDEGNFITVMRFFIFFLLKGIQLNNLIRDTGDRYAGKNLRWKNRLE